MSHWVPEGYIKVTSQDFRSRPVVKTLPSNATGTGSNPRLRAKIPRASWPTNQNLKQKKFVTNSIKTLKMVYVKKKKNLKKN